MGDPTAYKITVTGPDAERFWDTFEAHRVGHDDPLLFDLHAKWASKWRSDERLAGIMFWNVTYTRGGPIYATIRGIPDGLFYRDDDFHGLVPTMGFETLALTVEIVGGSPCDERGNPWSYRAVVENGVRTTLERTHDLSLLEKHSPQSIELLRDLYPYRFAPDGSLRTHDEDNDVLD